MKLEKFDLLFDAVIAARTQLDALEQALRSAACADLQPVLRPIQNEQTRLLLQTDFPRIGGRDFTPERTPLFASAEFQSRWAPSGVTRAIYAGACNAMGRLATRLCMPLYKVATTDSRRVWPRMNELRTVSYGSVYCDGQRYVAEPGWNNWFPSQMHVQTLPSPDSPVIITSHAILVPLPVGMTTEEFDVAFDAETRKGALDRWALTPEGRNHCATLGIDPAVMRRLTEYPGGESSRLSPAGEICGFSCRGTGPDRVIAIAEAIILRKLGLID